MCFYADSLLPLIVQCEKPGTDELQTLLLIVSESHIKEIDSVTGRTVDRLELKCIQSIEQQLPKVSSCVINLLCDV